MQGVIKWMFKGFQAFQGNLHKYWVWFTSKRDSGQSKRWDRNHKEEEKIGIFWKRKRKDKPQDKKQRVLYKDKWKFSKDKQWKSEKRSCYKHYTAWTTAYRKKRSSRAQQELPQKKA